MRSADLTPPLGWPGGPCYLIDRIQEDVANPKLRDHLIDEVQHNEDLSNQDAAQVYSLDVEPGVGMFKQFALGPHVQYRMDLRGVTVPQIRATIQSFLKMLLDAKSRGYATYQHYVDEMNHGESVMWTDTRLGLTIVFVAEGRGPLKVITTYWKGEPDPKWHGGKCAGGYQAPAGELVGVRTHVKNPDGTAPHDTDGGGYKEQVLPSPQWSRSKPTGKPSYNGPGSSGTGADGQSLHEDKARTKGVPGDDSPHPNEPAQSIIKRRPGLAASLENVWFGLPHEAGIQVRQMPKKRQRRQRGLTKLKSHREYTKHRSQSKQHAKIRYRKLKRNPNFKRQQKIRREHPERFKRRMGSFLTAPEIAFVKGSDMIPGYVREVSGMTGFVTYHLDGRERSTIHSLPVEKFLDDVTFLSDEDIDAMFELLDMELWDGEDHDDDDDDTYVFGEVDKAAGELIRKEPLEHSPGQYLDRAHGRDTPDADPGNDMDWGYVWDNPGSSRVIPEYQDFVNKTAARIADIESGCDQDLINKSEGVQLKLRRVDQKNRMWTFGAKGSKGDYIIKVKTLPPKGNVTSISKMDVMVSCSCPYWQWQGPEFYADQRGYLLGAPRGTASSPDVKDPEGSHGACKHVIAVLRRLATGTVDRKQGRFANVWVVPEDVLNDWSRVGGHGNMAHAVAERYLNGQRS